ncbi:MAG: DUF805 domain-containing protein [Muribaculaceae bacterium]|nr:DUF805 domain-containing protein [Muribaculaceae bacterium]
MYQYPVPFGEAIRRAFNNYCVFTGRASRSEYWWFVLFTAIVGWAIGIILGLPLGSDSFIYQGVSGLWGLFIFLPSLGLCFRRLHDTGRSGWNILWALLPFIGTIILIVYFCQNSQMSDNQYGPVPNLRFTR